MTASPLIDSHIRMVFRAAGRFARNHGGEYGEWVTSGYIGLMEAEESFDPNKGAAFATHAHRRIKGAMFDQYRREYAQRGQRAIETNKRLDEFVSVRPVGAFIESEDFIQWAERQVTNPRHKREVRMLAGGLSKRDMARREGVSESMIHTDMRKVRPILRHACAGAFQ